jgi:hypothetical protein
MLRSMNGADPERRERRHGTESARRRPAIGSTKRLSIDAAEARLTDPKNESRIA